MSNILDNHPDSPRRLNQLAREQLKLKLLNDVLMDMEICKLEGWDIIEYVKDLIDSLSSLLKH